MPPQLRGPARTCFLHLQHQFHCRTSHTARPYSRLASAMSASTAAIAYAASVTAASTLRAAPEDASEKRHHLKGKTGFTNPWPSWQTMPGYAIGAEMVKRRMTGQGNSPDTTPPTVNVRQPRFLPTRETERLRATWLGHACYFVEFPTGLRVLFDPVFSERCSPFQWLGPKRYTRQPCGVDEIPVLDAVVISHNHYDHLDHPTIMKLWKRFPSLRFFVPLGNKSWFVESGITKENVTELDWWEECDLTLTPTSSGEKHVQVETKDTTTPSPQSQPRSPNTITARLSALPCQHMGNRGLFDRGHTLWSSWSIHSGQSSLYFAGDTGYRSVPKGLEMRDDHTPSTQPKHPHCPAFADIGRLRGPFDLGLVPIGAYEPRFVMSPMHADPYDAVEIFRETRCRRALAMHWGTWVLTEEDVLEPPRILRDALARRKIAEVGVFDALEVGESREFESHGDVKSVDWEGAA